MTTSDFNPVAHEFCDRLNEWLEDHERVYHDGEKCMEERGNMLAYIAHRIGYDRSVFDVMADRLLDYKAMHEEHDHGEEEHEHGH